MVLIYVCNGVMDLEVVLDDDGHIFGMKIWDIVDEGVNVLNFMVHLILKFGNLINCYCILVVCYEVNLVMINKCSLGVN